VNFFYSGIDAFQCGTTLDVQSDGIDVTAQVPLEFTPSQIRIADFDFIEACGSHHVFDEIGVACNELAGFAGSGSVSLNCQPVAGNSCPAACE
jgi:hypothetical protein